MNESVETPNQEWTRFLETTPPNTPMKIQGLAKRDVPSNLWFLPNLHIHLHCERDDGLRRRFDLRKNFNLDISQISNYRFITYLCSDCRVTYKTFAVLAKRSNDVDVEAMKLGEFPPFSVPISSRIQKLLAKSDLDLYRKGVYAEAQGLGIGAATYFRRIVDEQWTRLVTEIRQAAKRLGVKDLRVYDVALKETQFSKAVKRLKDAIPKKLLILDGKNPLTLLYQPLSKQLHELTDEECLQQAADIRVVLTALLENISDVLKDQDELRGAAMRLENPKQTPDDTVSQPLDNLPGHR